MCWLHECRIQDQNATSVRREQVVWDFTIMGKVNVRV